MRRDSRRHTRSVALDPGRFHARNWAQVPQPSCAQKVATHFSQWSAATELERWGVIPLAIFLVARAGSRPAVRNIVDRQDGREDQGRAPRRGRRGLCRRDGPGAARDLPAHIRVQLRAQSGSAASSTPASVSWKRMEVRALITRTR